MWGGAGASGGGSQKCRPAVNDWRRRSNLSWVYLGGFQPVRGGRPNLPIKCPSICLARFVLGRSNLATRRFLMHGVAPHMCDKSSATLLGGEAGGRSPGIPCSAEVLEPLRRQRRRWWRARQAYRQGGHLQPGVWQPYVVPTTVREGQVARLRPRGGVGRLGLHREGGEVFRLVAPRRYSSADIQGELS
jgi:hypothetical protein